MADKYQDLKAKLGEIVNKLQDEAVDVDEAVVLHKEAQKVLASIDKYLADTEHSFKVINKT